MLASPAKRRKTTANSSVVATDANTNQASQTAPTTPTRASYQSPTKASLARSHPHLVSPSKTRSSTESRGRSLRNALLGRRTVDSSSGTHSLESGTTDTSRSNELHENDGVHGPKALNVDDPEGHELSRPPLRPRQASSVFHSENKPSIGRSNSHAILPKLVKESETASRTMPRSQSKEPSLPPTPVQLGIDPAPERPRGLASSSSPRGSKSGSGRHRRRIRGDAPNTTSPLKPKNRLTIEQATEEPASGVSRTQEALESEADGDHENDLSPQLREKRTAVDGMKRHLQKLQTDIAKLENAIVSLDPLQAFSDESDLLELLKFGPGCEQAAGVYAQEAISGGEQNLHYLTLFAPGNLHLSTNTTVELVDGKPKVIHTLCVTAPPPWPPYAFSATFEVITDAEDVRVEKVICTDVPKKRHGGGGVQNELQKWIDARFESDLHCLDVGGMIWGIGKYFDECIARAKVLKRIDDIYNHRVGEELSTEMTDTAEEQKLTGELALALSRYLTVSQLAIDLEEEQPAARTRKGQQSPPKIILVWQIDLTWSGSVKSTQEIAPTGINAKAQEAVQEVFYRLVKSQNVTAAFKAVWDLLKNGKDDKAGEVRTVKEPEDEKKRTKPRKRKRITR